MPIDMEREARALQKVLADRGLDHLRVVKRGKALILESGPAGDGDPEARLSNLSPRTWRLDLRHHTGRWEETPFVGDIAELIETAVGIGRLADF